jgi:hypothetical protein
MNTNNHQRLESLFSNILSLYECFVKRVTKEVMEPFFLGDVDVVKENIDKFGFKISVDRLFFMLVRNFQAIVNLRRDLDRHYNVVEEEKESTISSDELETKISNLLGDLKKLHQ